jgi:hypothetical protein
MKKIFIELTNDETNVVWGRKNTDPLIDGVSPFIDKHRGGITWGISAGLIALAIYAYLNYRGIIKNK